MALARLCRFWGSEVDSIDDADVVEARFILSFPVEAQAESRLDRSRVRQEKVYSGDNDGD